MHEKNFELLQEEAIRLITVESNFLRQLAQTDGLIMAAGSEDQQTFDQESVKEIIDVLTGEKIKLEKQELVLAVVGTMKAGKSTTINAIVGAEILPNRNRPMTALPTLIRHKAGQKEPLLFLQNKEPLTEYIQQLKNALKTQNIDEELVGAENRDDMYELALKLKKEFSLQEQYLGSQEIYEFLKILNDLVRFSVITKTPFPFASYNNVDNLPAIEVEFAHLSDYGNQIGGLTLLDTPGPNEAGQEHLKPMLREQLKKASAVLTVLDYTQLKSNADDEVRKELQQVLDECDDRLFVLVNKFDQRDRNADSAESLTKYVSENLMGGAVSPANIYPVSANRAYLACRALAELAEKDALDVNQSWVPDFAKVALGEDWEEDIHDRERVLKRANSVWEKAGFIAPLQDVIKGSHEKAGILSLDSAVTKINNTAQDVENFLEVRHTGLKSSVEELQNQISNLKKDIELFAELGEEANDKLRGSATQLERSCNKVFADIKREAIGEIDYYLKVGKEKEKAQWENSAESKRTNNQGPVARALGSMKKVYENKKDFDASNPVIRFETRTEAEELQAKIKSRLNIIIEGSVAGLGDELVNNITKFDEYLNIDLKCRCERLIAGIQSELQTGNFKINIRLPEFNFLHTIDLSVGHTLNETKMRKEVERGRRRSEGILSSFSRWVSFDHFGWEDFETERTYYDVDINAIKDKVSIALDTKLKETSENVKNCIVAPLKEDVDKLFVELTSVIEKIRADLIQSVRDHQSEKSVQDELISYLKRFSLSAHEIHLDSIGLTTDVKEILSNTSIGVAKSIPNALLKKQGAENVR